MIDCTIKDTILNKIVNESTEMTFGFDSEDSKKIFGYNSEVVGSILDYFESIGLIDQDKFLDGEIMLEILIPAHDLVSHGGFTAKEELLTKNMDKLLLEIENLKQILPERVEAINAINSAIKEGLALFKPKSHHTASKKIPVIFEHAAIWTDNLEALKEFYIKYLDGQSNEKYINEKKQYQSYFISFGSGARLELMNRPHIPVNQNDTISLQHKGIIHLAFELATRKAVDEKAKLFIIDGFKILDGPRTTGDGFYEFVTLDPDNNRIEITTRYS